MSVHLPLIFVLGALAFAFIKFHRVRWWGVIALVLFGFLLAHTFLGPAINDGTNSGTQIVNGH
ncbi:hypothetical protein [Phaeacidiphilus oryzae]|uniref:hypothetical protein n=1 Tax=Phaeacidiphilus oryzae TaxID=348818 RepID=UPI0005626598|nr:hypothetical protein [Phaeacidiphilus oryzae]